MTRPLRVVLDTSAIVAYTHGSVHVGEVLAEVADEPARFGLPVACLVSAAVLVKDPHRLELLAAQVLGRLDLAAAIETAIQYDNAYLLTAEPEGYAPAGDAVSIIAV